MSRKYNNWTIDSLPVLDEHSCAKHDVLETYVKKYLEILCKRYGMTSFKITLVDGFAGGGLYEGEKPGSPLILLQAVESAEATINEYRKKEFTIDAHYYFIEKVEKTFSTLSCIIGKSRYGGGINKTIFLKNGAFEEYVDTIIERTIKRHPRKGGRIIFFLDQTGYSHVHPSIVRKIINRLPHAEFIITIPTDYFTGFINDKDTKFNTIIKKLGFEPYLNLEEISRLKKEKPDDWKYIVESKWSFAWKQATGATYIRPFFLEPEYTSRGYWLLHLSPHPAAHDAMTEIHWEKGNYFRHYGSGRGLDIFGYKPKSDSNSELSGISFGDIFREENIKSLKEELPSLIWDIWKFKNTGLCFEELIDKSRNYKAITNDIIEKVSLELWKNGIIQILGSKGYPKKENSQSLSKDDILLLPPQKKIIFPNK